MSLCLDESLETLRPICYRGTHSLQGDLCCYFYEGSLQAVQVVVTLSATHVLQNNPSLWSRGLRSGLPEGQPSALIKATPESSWPCGQELSPAGRPISDH